MTENTQDTQKNMSEVIWDVANTLRRPFKKSEYGWVILLFTVLRRCECVMEPNRDKALHENKTLKTKTDNETLQDQK